LEVRLI